MMEHSKHWVSLYIIIVLPCFQCSKTNFIESQEPVYDIKIDEVPLGFAKDGSQVLSEDEFDSSKVVSVVSSLFPSLLSSLYFVGISLLVTVQMYYSVKCLG